MAQLVQLVFATGGQLARGANVLYARGVGTRVVPVPVSESGCGRGLVIAADAQEPALAVLRQADIPVKFLRTVMGSIPNTPVPVQIPNLADRATLIDFLYEADQALIQPVLDQAARIQIEAVETVGVQFGQGCGRRCAYCPEAFRTREAPIQGREFLLNTSRERERVWITGGEYDELVAQITTLPDLQHRVYLDVGFPGWQAPLAGGWIPVANFRLPGDPEDMLVHPRAMTDYPTNRPYLQNLVVEVPTVTWEAMADLMLAVVHDEWCEGFRVRPFQPVAASPLGIFAAGCTFSTLKVVAALRILAPTAEIWVDSDSRTTLKDDGPDLLRAFGANGWIEFGPPLS